MMSMKNRMMYTSSINAALRGTNVAVFVPDEATRDEWRARLTSSDLTPDATNPYLFSFKLGGSIEVVIAGEMYHGPKETVEV